MPKAALNYINISYACSVNSFQFSIKFRISFFAHQAYAPWALAQTIAFVGFKTYRMAVARCTLLTN